MLYLVIVDLVDNLLKPGRLRVYTCQLTRIMCESHPCGSNIVISRIQINFSCLTDNSESNRLKTSQIKIQLFFDVREVIRTSLGLFNNVRDWLEILWKSLLALF